MTKTPEWVVLRVEDFSGLFFVRNHKYKYRSMWKSFKKVFKGLVQKVNPRLLRPLIVHRSVPPSIVGKEEHPRDP